MAKIRGMKKHKHSDHHKKHAKKHHKIRKESTKKRLKRVENYLEHKY